MSEVISGKYKIKQLELPNGINTDKKKVHYIIENLLGYELNEGQKGAEFIDLMYDFDLVDKYVFIGNDVYEVELIESRYPDSSLFLGKKTGQGEYECLVTYYNGVEDLNYALSEAVKNGLKI